MLKYKTASTSSIYWDTVETKVWTVNYTPDSKVHGANMGPIWGRQDPGGPFVGPMNFAIWDHKWWLKLAVCLLLPLLVFEGFEISQNLFWSNRHSVWCSNVEQCTFTGNIISHTQMNLQIPLCNCFLDIIKCTVSIRCPIPLLSGDILYTLPIWQRLWYCNVAGYPYKQHIVILPDGIRNFQRY